jgi:hypothetical protein
MSREMSTGERERDREREREREKDSPSFLPPKREVNSVFYQVLPPRCATSHKPKE